MTLLRPSLHPVPFFMVWSAVNSVAWYYQSTQALPFTTIVLIMCIWLIGQSSWPPGLAFSRRRVARLLPPHCLQSLLAVGFPLTVLGGILGKNLAGGFDAPCRTKNIAREIPPAPWYRSFVVHMAIGGFLPFR